MEDRQEVVRPSDHEPIGEPSSSSPPRSVLRVMCLHDAHSHALELKESLTAIGERLYERHGIDLVYVNAPLAVLDPTSRTRRGAGAGGAASSRSDAEEPRRVWWHDDDTDGHGKENHLTREAPTQAAAPEDDGPTPCSPSSPASPTYLGLDASLLHLQQVWTAGPPFWGLLGVGQGGAVASVFALLPTTFPPPQCLVFCDTTQALLGRDDGAGDNDNDDGSDGALSRIPTLHLGTSHPRLALQFPCGARVVTEMKTEPGTGKRWTLNAVGRFLVERRRATMAGHDQGNRVLALQTALHSVQIRAAELLAAQIAENPPAALMAVIHPQHVAGWKGNKRRQPGEEGGGAPCPPEFLLHRERRTAATAGESRAHPDSVAGC